MREALRRWLSTLGGSPVMPVTLDRRRIFVLPTGAGIAWGCALLAMLLTSFRHSRENGNPESLWVPVFTGTTGGSK